MITTMQPTRTKTIERTPKIHYQHTPKGASHCGVEFLDNPRTGLIRNVRLTTDPESVTCLRCLKAVERFA